MAVTKVMAEVDDWGFLPAQEAPLATTGPIQVAHREQRREQLKELEDRMLERSLTVVSDALYARDIDANAKEVPREWMDIDPDEAVKRLRTANAAWMNKKEAPVFLEIGKQVMVGIIKARATEKAAPKTLNVQVIQMSAPLPKFEVIEMESDDG
jgi:hypothetical protein